MTGPCQYGFRCPHTCWNDDDRLCLHPLTPMMLSSDASPQLFPMVDEMDCPLTDVDSELYRWMMKQEEEP